MPAPRMTWAPWIRIVHQKALAPGGRAPILILLPRFKPIRCQTPLAATGSTPEASRFLRPIQQALIPISPRWTTKCPITAVCLFAACNKATEFRLARSFPGSTQFRDHRYVQRAGRGPSVDHSAELDEQFSLWLHPTGTERRRCRNRILFRLRRTEPAFCRKPKHVSQRSRTQLRGRRELDQGKAHARVWRIIHNNTASNAVSFDSASSGAGNISQAAIAGTGQSFDPAAFGYPAVGGCFGTSYDNALTSIAGLLSTITANNNYRVSQGGTQATLLPVGQLIPRHFKANEFEWYVEDSYRLKPNLTVTLGVRHSLLETPYEVNGQQVAPASTKSLVAGSFRVWAAGRAHCHSASSTPAGSPTTSCLTTSWCRPALCNRGCFTIR